MHRGRQQATLQSGRSIPSLRGTGEAFMVESDYEFDCPYCGEQLWVRLDRTSGTRQDFIQDCEVCCRPIRIRASVSDGDIVDFSAVTDDEP